MVDSTARKIVLTGATRGLGRVLLDRFVERGHQVCACGRNASAIDELRERFPSPHDFESVDVSDWAQVEAWSRRVLAAHGPPDLLINNAAVINQTMPLWKVAAHDFSGLIDVNVKGTFHVIRGFLPAMVEVQRGVVVNFSSGWGRSVDAEVAPYCASKWAIEGLTLALAQELPPGMAAVPLNPGVIDTDMLRSCWGDFAATCHKPDAWSHAAADLILGLSSKDNGQQLAVSLSASGE